jgi:fatty acid-binding protein DegV
MASIAIVTDSTADLPQEETRRWDIHVIPAVVSVQGKTLFDGVDISRADLYSRLPAMDRLPSTAAPPPGEFATLYERLLTKGAEAVLSIHLAQTLSGLFDMAVQAADVTALLQMAQSVRQRARLVARVESLRYLRRSGRVGWLQAGVNEVLNLRLVIELEDGQVRRVDQTRTRRQAEQSLLSKVKSWGELSRVAVMHVANREGASALAEELVSLCGIRPLIAEATTVLGTHVGPGAVGVTALLV